MMGELGNNCNTM